MSGHGEEILSIARSLQAVGQTGLNYVSDPDLDPMSFDADRYRECINLAARLAALVSEDDHPRILSEMEVEYGHATPKLEVRGVIVRGDEVLLIREVMDDLKWTLPGGWADVNESVSESIEREVREETGLLTTATNILSVWDRQRHNALPSLFSVWKIFVECEVVGGDLVQHTQETAGARFWPVDRLPELSERRVTPDQVRRCHSLCTDPDAPRVAMFD